MSKPTGRPRGRPRKIIVDRAAPTERQSVPMVRASRRHAGAMKKIFGLTPEEMDKLLPRDIFRMLAKVAMMVHDEKMLMQIARDWGPYEHARKSEGPQLTPEEIRRLGEIARSEAARRGLVVPPLDRSTDRALPN